MTTSEVFRFGDFTLDVGERRLLRGSQLIRLSPKSLDVLAALVREQGRVVAKSDLLARVWPDAFVEEGILTVHVSALRKALGDGLYSGEWIETVPRTGYRFNQSVTRVGRAASVSGDSATPVEALELVGIGRRHFLSGSSAQMPAALRAFQAALEIDSTCAPAHAGLALTRCAQAFLRFVPHIEAYAEAKAAALRALAMDRGSADAQAALGTVMFLSEWDWAAADRSLGRALEINPDHCEALLQYGALNDALGHRERGLRLKQQALARAPHSPLVLTEIAISYFLQRKFEQAIAWTTKALALDPMNLRASEFLTHTCWFIGDMPGVASEKCRRAEAFGVCGEARDVLERGLATLRDAYARGGANEVSQLLLGTFATGDDSRASVQRAALYASLGDRDGAFDQLDRALALRDPHLVYLGVHPLWDPLRADPRMADRLSQVGLPVSSQSDRMISQRDTTPSSGSAT